MDEPTKKDIEYVFKKLRSIPTNKVCFDCTAKNPTWASVTYGVFICIDCSAVHRSLGVHLSFVRSTQLDTNWTWTQLRQMQLGGNANAESFFQQHNCTTKDSQQKYNSRAAQLYKDKLHNAALQSIRLHGPKLNVERDSEWNTSSKEKDYDFFNEHTANHTPQTYLSKDSPFTSNLTNATLAKTETDESNTKQLFGESTAKHIIGNRKTTAKKGGLGIRKVGGLGAQKISTSSFADIEREAELAEKLKAQTMPEPTEQEDEIQETDQITSMRLAYEDLSIRQKKEEEKLKAVDPNKAKQMERLGMGFAQRSGVSHSALNDMKTIQQENAAKQITSELNDDFFDVDFSLSSISHSDFLLKSWAEARNSRNSTDSRNISSLLGDRKDSKSTNFSEEESSSHSSQYSEKKSLQTPVTVSDEAQKKFGSAKSISSDQFFSDNSENTFERSANLSRFEGSSSISSADFFNRNENIGRTSGATGNLIANSLINAPDLDDVKESVRQGVTKVAGRLSSLANGVMSSIQEKYGGY
ncbi:hypothetical protein O3M35_003936 [Rhynocoris fuscipes]|uniref:Arf-GAP domain-containing protein n=1 Tax=Rhynocoris fuscipes TaxID=488301 RepID=A0AAW1CK41_9HEMI